MEEEFIHFMQQGCIKLIKSDSKNINNVTKDYFKQIYLTEPYSSKKTLKNGNSNQHIIMIPEGSCM